jgi:DNA helicase-2/ATP-dependent DNA helicase PcrA
MTSLRLVLPPDPVPVLRHTLLSGHPASAHQSAVFDAVADPRSGSRMVIAVAGSGKTTTVKNALRHLPPGATVQLFAFNTDAAKSLKAGLAEIMAADGDDRYVGVRAGTFHSVGYAALLRFLGVKADGLKPDGGKIRKILKSRLTPDDYDVYASFVRKLVGLAKGDGIGALKPDLDEAWFALIDHHGMSLDSEDATLERAVEIARKTLVYSSAVAKERHVIDYDDMLYLPLLWRLRLWRNDVIFVDEAQDTNPVRRAIVKLALKPGGRLFAVGDPHQSIYGFTGASTDAMDIIRREFRATDLPLSVSYRCSRAVVMEAQRWVNHIEAADGAPQGSVEWLSEAKGLDSLTNEDAVGCRQTAPLVRLAYSLIAKGRGCRILGKEIGEELVALVEAQRAKGVDRLIEKLSAWRDREVAKFEARGEETAAEAVADRVECVMVCIKALSATERTVPALIRRLTALFEERPDARLLTLATIHKLKGLEFPQVGILRPDLMPSRAARQDHEVQQEYNLQYVAATRAKLRLVYLEPE